MSGKKQENENNHEPEPDKLMVVAHPDDEMLWGGANLILSKGWKVIVATNRHNKVRAPEFYKAMLDAGVWETQMFASKDTIEENKDTITGTQFDRALKQEAKKKWKLILTHNRKGEYGHKQHRLVHQLVSKHFIGQTVRFFKVCDKRLPKNVLDEKRRILSNYVSQSITHSLFTKQDRELTKVELAHFTNECIYVTPEKPKIPKIIHQIWVGEKMPEFKKFWIRGIKDTLIPKGWKYKLWKNKDITPARLPFTHFFIQIALEAGEKSGLKSTRFAQVADLMRYEIVRRYGGVYVDTNFELLSDITQIINQENKKGTHFLGANEYPCGLNCKDGAGRFLSNGFFASIPNSDVLRRATSMKELTKIDFNNPWINTESGPFFLRRQVKNTTQQKVKLLPTYIIYPFNPIPFKQFKASRDLCITKKRINNKQKKVVVKGKDFFLTTPCDQYPRSLMVNHFVAGGTWFVS